MRSSEITHPGPTTSLLLYWFARLWMFVFRWDVEGGPPDSPTGVVIAAPHTSNWDLAHMLAASLIFRFRVSWLGKDSLFRPPFGWFMRALGGVPVDRSAPGGLVQQAADALTRTERLMIAVPPSGTRGKRDGWKSGFYWIAHTAQVPVVCGYLDYSRRVAGLGYAFVPSGDVAADMEKVREVYATFRGKFPELESTIQLKEERLIPENPATEDASDSPMSEDADDSRPT
ncbi:MAG: lysophospholipid acyltransferase family protein [Myxococcales bacterium]|nr:lysophospholipid acyltransferase family protein [Myxococcales bacterium]